MKGGGEGARQDSRRGGWRRRDGDKRGREEEN